MTSHIGGAMPLQAVTELASWENEGGHSLRTAQAGERLEWEGFVARFYPHAHKHDYVPIAAYVEYRKYLEHRT
jgi:hypothetical protein